MIFSVLRNLYALLAIVLLFSISSSVHAQGNQAVYFEIDLPGNQIAYDLSTLPYDNIVLVGQHQDDAHSALLGWLYVLTKNGSAVSQYRYQEPGYSISFKGVEMFGLQQALVVAERTNLTTLKKQFGILTFSLNQQSQPLFLSSQWLSDSLQNTHVRGFCRKPGLQPAVWIFGEDQASLDGFISTGNHINIFDGPGRQVIYGLRPLNDSILIVLAGGITSASRISVLYVDLQFNILNLTDLPEEIYEPSGFDMLNDSTWICTATTHYCLPASSGFRPKDVAIITGTWGSAPRRIDCTGVAEINDKPSGISANRLGNGALMSYTSGQRVFVPQGQGYGRNRVPLVRLDTTGNITEQTWATPEAYYEVHQVKRPRYQSDGKMHCITGSVYDVYQYEKGTNAFMIFLNEDVVLSESPIYRDMPFTIFPSPAASGSILNISGQDILVDALDLIDMSGKWHPCNRMGEGWQLPAVPTGLYIGALHSRGQVVQYQKIIIQ